VPAGASLRARLRGALGGGERTEYVLGALAATTLVLIVAMVVTVFVNAWPSFQANGLSWFGSGGDVNTQLHTMEEGTALPGHSILYFRAWPLIWGTIITTVPAVLIALAISTLAAIFMTEFAPELVRRTLEPVVRLLAGVPSIVYGLIGILALAPYIDNHLISEARRRSVHAVVQLEGANLMLAILILAVMITPIMVALIAAALGSVPDSWKEGSAALGVNRWRTIVRVSLHTARPAIVAATVFATARALGEAIMLALVAGGKGFPANPLDGITFLFEPVQPLAATIALNASSLTIGPVAHTLYAIAAVLLVSAGMLSFAGWAAKQPLKKYGIRA